MNCEPREVELGAPVYFKITGAKVRVRVELDDLMLALGPEEEGLFWHAAVRRLPFVYEKDGTNYPHTIPVDSAPDRMVLNPAAPPPPWAIPGEPPATWVPRGN